MISMFNSPFLLQISFLLVLVACSGPGKDESPSEKEQQSVRTMEEFNSLILKNPNSSKLYLQRAALHKADNSLTEAFNDVNRAVRLDSLSSEAQYELGALHYMVGNMGEAKFTLERAIELDPSNTDAILEIAEVYFVLTNHNRSMRMINDALKIDAQLTKGYFLKGLIYKEQNNYELARSSLQTVTELDPDHVEAFNLLGMLHAADGDSLALQYYETALAIDSTNLEVLYNRGYFFQDRLMAEEAIEAYNKMLDHHPGSAAAHFNKGYVQMGLLSEPEKAIDSFTEAIRHNPQYYQAYSNRAVCLEELGRRDQAISDYERALEIFPNFEPAILGLNRLN